MIAAPIDPFVYDPPPQQSTGKERDGEAGLGYFEARYTSSAQGSWTQTVAFGGRGWVTEPTNSAFKRGFAYDLHRNIALLADGQLDDATSRSRQPARGAFSGLKRFR